VNQLQTRLILVFLAATLAPVAATLWIATAFLEHSFDRAGTRELDALSKSLERTGREFYVRARNALRRDALEGRVEPRVYAASDAARWPEPVREFHASGDRERFRLSGPEGDRLEYLVRSGGDVRVYEAGLSGIGMTRLSEQYRQARERLDADRGRDLRGGVTRAYIAVAASVWLAAFVVLIFLARRISRPIRQLTAGLSELAAGNLEVRIESTRRDEIGQAIRAFNRTASELKQNRDRLVYLTQLASWQTLARKMGHELKNSLTPIRLTLEEILARHDEREAAQIIADELESLERRVRAFSDFAAEPPVRPAALDLHGLVEERIALLRSAHPEVTYEVAAAPAPLRAWADEDLVKGILTNLLENAAEAAGAGGRILAALAALESQAVVEVHDSGPGLSEEARRSLFQPTISFKKRGMGLGLSIARKSALLSGGDILPVEGRLGGAGFRVLLPCQPAGL
jgi:nitrogen fixation/metabolism regulation signal transduction histidine kinase